MSQFQLGKKEREAVEWGWNQKAGNSMFHLVNAYTRAAQFEALPAEASYRLQKVGVLLHVRPFEPLLVDLNKGFKMVLHAPVIIRRLRVPGTVNGGRSG